MCQMQAYIPIIFKSAFYFPKITRLIDLPSGHLLLLLQCQSCWNIFIPLKVTRYTDISNFSNAGDVCFWVKKKKSAWDAPPKADHITPPSATCTQSELLYDADFWFLLVTKEQLPGSRFLNILNENQVQWIWFRLF